MTKKSNVIPIRKLPKPSIREKLLQAELEHTMKRARDALYRYGAHFNDCPARLLLPDADDKCTCKLYDVINSFHIIK